jgi:uncharacterized membrane protein
LIQQLQQISTNTAMQHLTILNALGLLGILITLIATLRLSKNRSIALLPIGAFFYLIGRGSAVLAPTSVHADIRSILLTSGLGMVAFGIYFLYQAMAEKAGEPTAEEEIKKGETATAATL